MTNVKNSDIIFLIFKSNCFISKQNFQKTKIEFNMKGSDNLSLSIVKSISLQGLDGVLINVEVDISSGMPTWEVVGLPDTSIRESKERVRTAIKNCGYEVLSRKYIINLSPANIKKEGSMLDLAIAVGILRSMDVVEDCDLSDTVIVGELSLDGTINKVNGVLPIAIESLKYGIKRIIVPKENAKEAAIVSNLEVIGVSNLNEVIKFLNSEIAIENTKINIDDILKNNQNKKLDFAEVKGQKRALEIAASGGHNCFKICNIYMFF